MSEHEKFLKRDTHLAIYGMLLVVSDTQPDIRLPWWEVIGVELGADEMDEYLAAR